MEDNPKIELLTVPKSTKPRGTTPEGNDLGIDGQRQLQEHLTHLRRWGRNSVSFFAWPVEESGE